MKLTTAILTGSIVNDDSELTLGQLCQACAVHAEVIVEMVKEGILEPEDQAETPWRFEAKNLRRARTTLRLCQDLSLNLAGAALVLELLDEIETLRAQLRRGEKV